ncbi:sugar phosphate isomerase/epimerase [Thermostilla marina]
MAQRPRVLLSGFADEAAINKTAVEQFAAFAALGLQYFSIRFIDVGNGIKNVMKLTDDEIDTVRKLMADYGLKVSSIGSPIGKVKLKDVDDGTKNVYIPFEKYLAEDVARACELANRFETKLIRGFSFYHPKDTDPEPHIPEVADKLGQIADACQKAGVIFGLEVEANLVGQNGRLLAEIYKQVNHPAMVLIFDGANLVVQGYTQDDIYQEYLAMKPGLGWLHIKDYRRPQRDGKGGHVDEDMLKNFVPANMGDTGHEQILRDFAEILPELEQKLAAQGVPGVFLDLEPHVKGGGQFGGFSGPDGLGVALRGLCSLLDYVGIDYHLRDFDDIKAARGF